MESVVSLGVIEQDASVRWIGTGFLVGRKEDNNPSISTVYLITNKHVIRNQHNLLVRFNNIEKDGVQDLPVTIFGDDGKTEMFSAHPNDNADIVAIIINPNVISAHNLRLAFIDLESHVLSLQEMENTGVDVGSIVYAAGFPMNLVTNELKAPICRLGCISRIADAFANKKEATAFLVDAQTYPGNSGGPIFSRPEIVSITGTNSNNRASLIGVLSAYIPYEEALLSAQTGRLRMVQEENSGLTIVHPVDRIKEVVEMEKKRFELQSAIMQDNKLP